MTMPTANELLMSAGEGGRSATFNTIGEFISGEIVAEPTVSQQTDPADRSLKTFPNGDPMLQVVFRLQTAERIDGDDDGIRMLYAKNKMLVAIKEAIIAAECKAVGVGGQLTVQFISGGERLKTGLFSPKEYRARYVPPATPANALLGLTSPQPAAQPAPALPPMPPAPQTAAAAGNGTPPPPPPTTNSAAPPPGIPADVWARLTPIQQQALSNSPAGVAPY
jgi:hypothetical protein